MKNINCYTEDCLDFHKQALLAKRNPSYKSRIENLEDQICERFLAYNNHFEQNSFEQITPSPFSQLDNEKEDLKKLYSYKSKIISELKIKLTTNEKNRIISTCPNCTISEINSFDHYLPKDDFPEFVVNPKNLFPSCTICNGYKNEYWLKDDKRLFLNLYLDRLPNLQFLFVELEIDKDVITPNFYLENSCNIDEDLYWIIESHYKRLKLCKRFKENCNETISYIENVILSSLNQGSSKDEIINIIMETNIRERPSYGYNYWKLILQLSLITNENFLSRYF